MGANGATGATGATGAGDYNGFRVPGSGFRVPSSGFRVPSSGFRVHPRVAQGVQRVMYMPGARKPQDLVAWQLAWELKDLVYAFTAKLPASTERKFCDEIREAARSAPDNISEGFYRFSPPDFASFLRYARGSLGEVQNQLRQAHSAKYLSDAEYDHLSKLCDRALGAVTRLRNYLLRCPKNFDPRKMNPNSGPSEP